MLRGGSEHRGAAGGEKGGQAGNQSMFHLPSHLWQREGIVSSALEAWFVYNWNLTTHRERILIKFLFFPTLTVGHINIFLPQKSREGLDFFNFDVGFLTHQFTATWIWEWSIWVPILGTKLWFVFYAFTYEEQFIKPVNPFRSCKAE